MCNQRATKVRKSVNSIMIPKKSGRQALTGPAAIRQLTIAKPIVQPVLATLPEFDQYRRHPIAAPVRRALDVVAALVLPFECAHALLQEPAVRDDRALRR